MLKRTITAIISLMVLIPILIFSGTIVLPIAVAVFTCIALFEMYRCLGVQKNLILTIPFYIAGACSPFAMRYLRSDIDVWGSAVWVMALLMLYVMAVVVISRNKTTFIQAASVFASSFYICFSFCGIIYMRDMENEMIYLLIFIGAWITDIFAYLVGRAIGRHKLCPDVSPKKTIEGSIGGIVFCAGAFVLWAYIIDIMYIGIPILILAGIVASCVSQIGDLSMSAIKRQHGIKDYGKLFPGHGGVLDRFDSVLAVSSVVTIIFAILNVLSN